MNKIFYLIMSILFVFWLCMGFYIFTSIAKGDHLEQEIPTQSNKQTDLFDDSIDNLSDFTSKLEAGKQGGIDSMGGEHGNPQGLQYITKKSKGELGGESGKLESIHENDLASRGREEMIKNDSLNELYTDYSRPLNKQHLKDAKTIANAQDELLGNLLEKLKDLGVDCKTIKGDKKIEPEYFLQTKTSNHKDTLYNQTFCEELRNTYNCNDIATLTCTKRSSGNINFITISPYELPNGLIRIEKVRSFAASGDLEHIAIDNLENKKIIKSFIALKIANSNIEIPTQSICVQLLGRTLQWHDGKQESSPFNGTIKLYYKTGDGDCLEWSENWTERCMLK